MQNQKTALRRLPVISASDDHIVFRASDAEAKRMIRQGKARLSKDGRAVILCERGELWPCRTRTARTGILSMIGRGQQYTTVDERRRINGFKKIFAEDWAIFHSAILDNLVIVRSGAAGRHFVPDIFVKGAPGTGKTAWFFFGEACSFRKAAT
jgi:hypothetical protein